jgi:hypothetical protein
MSTRRALEPEPLDVPERSHDLFGSRHAADGYSVSMERSVEIFAVIHLGIMGLSHILAPRVWADFFIALREKGRAGVFAVGFMSLFFGSIIAAFHSVWSGMGLVLTLVGWAQVLKATVYFLFPAIGMRGLQRVDREKPRDFVIAGVGLLVLAGIISFRWF